MKEDLRKARVTITVCKSQTANKTKRITLSESTKLRSLLKKKENTLRKVANNKRMRAIIKSSIMVEVAMVVE